MGIKPALCTKPVAKHSYPVMSACIKIAFLSLTNSTNVNKLNLQLDKKKYALFALLFKKLCFFSLSCSYLSFYICYLLTNLVSGGFVVFCKYLVHINSIISSSHSRSNSTSYYKLMAELIEVSICFNYDLKT